MNKQFGWYYPAIAEVKIGLPAARRAALEEAGEAVPKPLLLKAMLDTGCPLSLVAPAKIAALGLEPAGQHSLSLLDGRQVECPFYIVELVLDTLKWPEFYLIETPLSCGLD